MTIKDWIFVLAISGLGMMTANYIGFDVAFSQSLPSVLVLLRQIVLFVPLVLLVPRLGGLGINGVFLAPALTDLIVLVIAILMLGAEFRNLSRLSGK